MLLLVWQHFTEWQWFSRKKLTTSCLSVICSTSTSSSIKPLYRILLADSWSAFEYTAKKQKRSAVQIWSKSLCRVIFGRRPLLTQNRDSMQSGLHGLQPLLVIWEPMGESNVCEQQCLLVFRDVVHYCQRLHDFRWALWNLKDSHV